MTTIAQLKEQTKKIPAKPGIYLFSARDGTAFGGKKILYIGKALNLKKRLKSYLQTDDPRLQQMILETKKVDVIETESDIEALILESQYIKRYRPDFNIMLRDDKQYFYVGFTDENFPKIFLTHQPKNVSSISYLVSDMGEKQKILDTKYEIRNTNFIGPFTDGNALKTTIRLLRKIFQYCTCKQLHNNYCLNYHIGKCPGFCCLKDSPERSLRIAEKEHEYQKNIKAVKDILSGKRESLIKQFEKEMQKLGKEHKFEEALELQYKIEKLKRVFQNAQIIRDTKYEIPDTKTTKNSTNTLKQLANLIGITRLPLRIEAYDIANIQGKHAVGAMVVFTLRQGSGQAEWQPDKNEYRKFKIYTKNTANDVGMLKEILTRRFNHPEWLTPDLILIDGGKAQLNAATSIISGSRTSIGSSTSITVVALAKNKRHMGEKIFIQNKKEAVPLSKLPITVKNLLLQIDSEAHRFAINYYRNLHRKELKNSQLLIKKSGFRYQK